MKYKDRYRPMAGHKLGVTYTPVVAARLWYAYHYIPLGPLNWVFSREELAQQRAARRVWDATWGAKYDEFMRAMAQTREHKGVMAKLAGNQ